MRPARLRLLWAFPALAVLLVGFNSEKRLPTMTNGFRASGVVEGFFGTPYSFEQRRALLLFTARAGLDTYIYAPKEDPFHRDRWRDPYPAEYLAHFQELATLGPSVGVRFVYAIAPGLDYDPAAGDLVVLVQKLETIRATGVRDFCVFFDDVFGAAAGANPEVQADAVIGVFNALRASDPSTSLCFISQFYEGTAEQLATDSSRLGSLYPDHTSSEAYAAYQRIPLEVPIMWTGPGVFTDRLTVSEAAAFRAFAGRPVLLWDNYPVNDTLLMNDLFLGAYSGREPGLETALDGIFVNPMLQPEATEIALWTVGRALALGDAYDPATASAEALRLAVNQNRRALRPLQTLASHFQGHPVIGDTPESAELAAAVDAFVADRSARSRRTLTRLFRLYSANHQRLARELRRVRGNPALFVELEEASQKLALLGDAGLLALDLLKRHERGQAVDTQPFVAKVDEAKAIRWLVGKNQMAAGLAALLAERPPHNVDVFGSFFDRVLAEVGQ
jgi:hyaluronoglucosaminidase